MCASKQPVVNLSSLKNKMHTTPYHFNLLSDEERLRAFHEAIMEKARGVVYDIGAGCGILSILASFYSNTVYSVEIDSNAANIAEFNFKPFDNIHLINKDAKELIFQDKADLIICEMLDTALIDEEQVPVINSILKFLKKDGEVIPCKILNGAEIISMDRDYICYEDPEVNQKPDCEALKHKAAENSYGIFEASKAELLKVFEAEEITFPTAVENKVLGQSKSKILKLMSNFIIYSEINFKNRIEEDLEANIEFKILKKGIISGIKITTFTLLTENIICGPTPMLNPPLLVPTEKINVDIGDQIKIKLNYRMGGGLNSIRTTVKKIS